MEMQGARGREARPGRVSSVISALSVRKPEVQIPRLAPLARDDGEVQIPRLAPLARDDGEVQIPRLAPLARDDSEPPARSRSPLPHRLTAPAPLSAPSFWSRDPGLASRASSP